MLRKIFNRNFGFGFRKAIKISNFKLCKLKTNSKANSNEINSLSRKSNQLSQSQLCIRKRPINIKVASCSRVTCGNFDDVAKTNADDQGKKHFSVPKNAPLKCRYLIMALAFLALLRLFSPLASPRAFRSEDESKNERGGRRSKEPFCQRVSDNLFPPFRPRIS